MEKPSTTTFTPWGPLAQPPNLLILMTDQQRTAQHMPLAGLIDVVPTLAEICGIPDLGATYAVQGQSLAGAILNGDSGETSARTTRPETRK